MRPRCSVFIAVSLDGYIARRDGALDWLGRVEAPGEDYGYARFAEEVDTIVVGRSTYDVVLGFNAWPWKGKRVVVLTRRALDAKHDEEAYAGDVRVLVERLGREGSRRVYVDGGVTIRRFLDAGLVDDVVLSVVPVLLGDGVPLFAGRGGADIGLRLEHSRAFPSGLVQLRYATGAGEAIDALQHRR